MGFNYKYIVNNGIGNGLCFFMIGIYEVFCVVWFLVGGFILLVGRFVDGFLDFFFIVWLVYVY